MDATLEAAVDEQKIVEAKRCGEIKGTHANASRNTAFPLLLMSYRGTLDIKAHRGASSQTEAFFDR